MSCPTCNQYGEPTPTTVLVQPALGDGPAMPATNATVVAQSPTGPSDPSGLAFTGLDTVLLVVIALGLILSGLVVTAGGRFRRSHR